MPPAVKLRTDFTPAALRRFAASSAHANQSRRLLSLAAVLEGESRDEAARIGGMDRQTLRYWIHRFNEHGPAGLKDDWYKGPPTWLTAEQLSALAEIVKAGPDLAKDGVARWRRSDLKRVIEEQFGVVYQERSVGDLLHRLGFSLIRVRRRHPDQKAEAIVASGKTSNSR